MNLVTFVKRVRPHDEGTPLVSVQLHVIPRIDEAVCINKTKYRVIDVVYHIGNHVSDLRTHVAQHMNVITRTAICRIEISVTPL